MKTDLVSIAATALVGGLLCVTGCLANVPVGDDRSHGTSGGGSESTASSDGGIDNSSSSSASTAGAGGMSFPGSSSGSSTSEVPSGWEAERTLGHEAQEPSTGESYVQQAISANGDAFMVLSSNSSPKLWVRRYRRAADAWDPILQISDLYSDVSSPRIAVDDAGNAMVAWTNWSAGPGVPNGLYVSSFTAASGWSAGWSTPTVLAERNDGIYVDVSSLVMTGEGHAAVVAEFMPGSRSAGSTTLWSCFYEAHTGWSAASLMSSPTASAVDGHLAITTLGGTVRVVGAWTRESTEINTREPVIAGNVYTYDLATHAGSWGTPVLLDDDAADVVDVSVDPQVTIDASGTAWVAFRQIRVEGPVVAELGRARFRLNRYSNGAWTGPEDISALADNVQGLTLALNASGQALEAWQQDGQIWVRNSTATASSSAQLVSVGTGSYGDHLEIAMDKQGRALLVWTDVDPMDGGDSLWASEFLPSTGWTSAHVLASNIDVDWLHAVAFGPNGTGLATWTRALGPPGGSGFPLRTVFGSLYRF